MLTAEEIAHCDKMIQDDWLKEFKLAGDFRKQIMEAIIRADEINLKKLETIYPNLVSQYLKWRKG